MAEQRGNLSTLMISTTQGSEASVTLETEYSWTKSTDMLEGTSKSSGNHKRKKPGLQGYGINLNAFYDPTGSNSFDVIEGYQDAGTLIYWKITDGVSGNTEYSGQGYIDSLELGAPFAEFMTMTFHIDGDDQRAKAVIV